jgi:hypothetical protein
MKSTSAKSLLSLCTLCWLSQSQIGCASSYGHIPASGVVYGQTVETRVDSQLAAYYLEHFDDWKGSHSPEARRLAELPSCSDASLSRGALQKLSARLSVDVAGLYAAQCLIEANRSLSEEFLDIFNEIRELDEPAAAKSAGMLAGSSDFAVLIVPGWDYEDSGHITGSDFAAQRRQFSELGIANYQILIDPHGSVEQNATMVRSEIVRISRIHEQLVLVSASSSSPAVALALGDPEMHRETRAVRAWLNLGGILGGMRLIDSYSEGLGYLALRAFSLLEGWEYESVESMSAARSLARLAELQLPKDLVIINYIGIPFSGDISSRVSFFYSQLRSHGPNDGLTLIVDPVLPGTQTIVALGQDHFFADDPKLESRALALATLVFRTVARESAERREAGGGALVSR